jgi:hypothetical protein
LLSTTSICERFRRYELGRTDRGTDVGRDGHNGDSMLPRNFFGEKHKNDQRGRECQIIRAFKTVLVPLLQNRNSNFITFNIFFIIFLLKQKTP